MANLEKFNEDLPILVEAGLIAIKQGDEDSAQKLFKAIGILDPANSIRKVGFGLIAMHKMDLATARKYFEEVLAEEPKNYRAQSFLGFCCILSSTYDNLTSEERIKNLENGARIATKLIEEKDAPETTKQLAQSLLDWEHELQEKGAALAKSGGKQK